MYIDIRGGWAVALALAVMFGATTAGVSAPLGAVLGVVAGYALHRFGTRHRDG